jgi:mono/diheme cytochrome c family protein
VLEPWKTSYKHEGSLLALIVSTRIRQGMHRIVTLRAAVLLSAVLAVPFVACSNDAAASPTERVMDAGRDAYIISCARCHQQDGSGYSGIYPALAGNPLVTLHDARPLIDAILEGPGSMPAFRHALDPEQIANIATYIRNSWGNEASPVDAREVR